VIVNSGDRAACHAQLDAALDDALVYVIEPEVFNSMPEALRAALLRWVEWQRSEKRQQAHAQLDEHIDANEAMHERDVSGATRH
jgi:hypothetical protein